MQATVTSNNAYRWFLLVAAEVLNTNGDEQRSLTAVGWWVGWLVCWMKRLQ